MVGTYSRESANRVVGQADLVCFIGSETGGMTTHFWAVPKIGTPAIQIDIDPEALGRNYPLQAAVNGDAKVTLARMLEGADRTTAQRRKPWVDLAQTICRDWHAKYAGPLSSDAVPIRPERICAELTRSAARRRDRGGRHRSRRHVDGRHVRSAHGQSELHAQRRPSRLGVSRPGSARNARRPDRPVVTFTGDAGFWYHIGEIETAVRWKINAVTVVNNNGGGNQSKRGFDRAYGGTQTEQARELWTYSKVNFARIAEEMGALGIRVDRPSEISPALERALAADRPVIIDVTTDIDAIAPGAVSYTLRPPHSARPFWPPI